MKRVVSVFDPVCYIAGSYLAQWARWQVELRERVRARDDEARIEGRLLYAAPEAMR